MKKILVIPILAVLLDAASLPAAPVLSISYIGVTANNVFSETAPTIQLSAKKTTPGAMELVYWSTNLSTPKSQWVLAWDFTGTAGTSTMNLPIPPSWNQVYFYVLEE